MALDAAIAFPLGDRQGSETNLALAVTKSLNGMEGGPSLHLNLSWLHLIDGRPTERDDRYEAALGYSHPLGETMALLVDVTREEERTKGSQSNLVEAGVRYKLAEELVLSAGGGVGLGDESPEARIVVGVQRSFKLF